MNRENLLVLFQDACDRRRKLFGNLEMFRVFDAAGDSRPGFWADRFGKVLLLHLVREEGDQGRLLAAISSAAAGFAAAAQVETIYLRMHETDARRTARENAQLIHGQATSNLTLQENQIEYLLKFEESVNAGLFLDTRDLRGYLKQNSSGYRVLNTFCYTGSLGLASYCGGAKEVVQVDISKSVLNWARENFHLNQSSGEGEMRFICEDSRAFMRRELRRREKGRPGYKRVIIDPPSFGSCKNIRFQFERDVKELIELALRLLEPAGEIVLCTNLTRFSSETLLRQIEDEAQEIGMQPLYSAYLPAPAEDFLDRSPFAFSMRGVRVSF